jgi:thymidylate kinase
MILIIEGPDKAGKTTLSNALIKKYPGLLLKITDRPLDASRQQREKILEHYGQILNILPGNENEDLWDETEGISSFKNIILDRFFPSELVYSIKRGYDAMAEDDKYNRQFRNMEAILGNTEHLFIYCNPGLQAINERMKENPDDYVEYHETAMLMGRYDRYFKNTPLNWIRVDTSRPVESCLQVIHNKINMLELKK